MQMMTTIDTISDMEKEKKKKETMATTPRTTIKLLIIWESDPEGPALRSQLMDDAKCIRFLRVWEATL